MKKGGVFKTKYGSWRDGWVVSGWIGVAVGAVAALTGVIIGITLLFTTTLGVHYGKVNCNKFATASNYQTKFVRNSVWSWDCYANVNGHWLPIGQVRGNH